MFNACFVEFIVDVVFCLVKRAHFMFIFMFAAHRIEITYDDVNLKFIPKLVQFHGACQLQCYCVCVHVAVYECVNSRLIVQALRKKGWYK